MIAALALASFAFVAPAPRQDPPPLPPPPDAVTPAPVVLDADGEPVAAGRLPKSTAPEARAAWERLAAAVAKSDETRAPVTGFDLQMYLRLKISDNKTNDFPNARYAYLAPGYLLADTGNGRRQVRGPSGDWLYDATQPSERALVRLDVGRENAEDRRQLDDALDVARLFTLLLDARNVRVVRFAPAPMPEAFVPARLVELARKLDWFQLETPDVRPGAQNKIGARIVLGLARDGGLPALVLADDAAAPQRVNPTTSCVTLDQWKSFDGWNLPKKIVVFLPKIREVAGAGNATSRVADGWRESPAMELDVKSGTLAPKLSAADFRRPDVPR